ncbi:cyclase [Aureitalea marina]|uniref:Cyclase n=1 Tax=Aureitalea marina TaxID=930804 RepID=A0A2S7KTC9_9FLAO|nr:cyclase [Aureitalea marina]
MAQESILYDLSHSYSDETVYWVTARQFELDTVFAGDTDKGYYYSAYDFTTAEHGGTHLDAPIHFAKGKQAVDEVPLEKLIGPAIKIDVSKKAWDNPDYLVSVDDLVSWESDQGTPIPEGSIVLLYTAHSRHYPDALKYLGTDQRGDDAIALLHFPGLSPEAAQWLVDNRKINAIGLDTPSIDYGQSSLFESHVILLGENIPVFENLTNLQDLPASGFEIMALPMKIEGGSGAPLRVVARVSE